MTVTGPFFVLQPTPGNPDTMQSVPVSQLLLTEITQADPIPPFGVTVDEVFALCPEAERLTVPDGRLPTPITDARVHQWVVDVSNRVQAKIGDEWVVLEPVSRRETIRNAGRSVVAVGAASYLEAARYSTDRGVNDAGSYPDVLWTRYKESLSDLVDLVDRWVIPVVAGEGDGSPAAGSGAHWSFPPPVFCDRRPW